MSCSIFTTVRQIGLPTSDIQRATSAILKHIGKTNADVSIHCVGDKKMRQLNRIHRGVDRPTDVLSFPMDRGTIVEQDMFDLGDIFLSVPYIRRQAKRYKISFKEEFLRMLIHGILHSVGYDHGRASDAKEMFALQESLLGDFLRI